MPQQQTVSENQPSSEDWGYIFAEKLARGIDLSTRPELLEEEKSITADNIRFENDRVFVDYGYKEFGGVVRGTPRVSFQFFLRNGSSILTLITNSTIYRWNSVSLQWQYITDGAVTTDLTAASAASDTTLEVTDDTGFSDGDFIAVELDSGEEHQTTINGTPAANVITITDAIPSGENAAIANYVTKAVDLTGTDDHSVSVVTWPAFDKMYFTNNADNIKEFNGTMVADVSNLPNSGDCKAKTLAIFNNHLILMGMTDGGSSFPQRVRWSNPGSDSNFNESVNFIDLYDSEDFITGTESLGTYQIIYKERSIYRMEFLGLPDQRFQFTKTIEAEGALNQDAIINLSDEHLFIGNSNIYKYDGGFSLDPVGDPIYDKIFSSGGNLNTDFAHRSFAVYVEEIDDAWFFYPSGSDEYPKSVLRLNVSTGAWSEREFTRTFFGFGFFQSQDDLTWQIAPGTWQSYQSPWISKKLQAGSPTLHLLSEEDLRIYEYDYVTIEDNGIAIPYLFESKDYYLPNRDARFDRYDMMVKGTAILVEASYDQGQSWETLGTVSPGNTFRRERLFKQRIGRSLRLRFSGSGNFGLEWFGAKFKQEAIWRF